VAREIISLNRKWELKFDPENCGVADGWIQDETLEYDRSIPIPSTWNLIKPDYEGVAFYRNAFTLGEDYRERIVRLQFGAVNYRAEVFLNSKLIGTHEGGYTPFVFDISDSICFYRENVLVVRVIDPPNDGSGRAVDGLKHMEIPSGKESWYVNFSGIWQDVDLIINDNAYIDNMFITTDVDRGTVHVRMDVLSAVVCDGELEFIVTSNDGASELVRENRQMCIEKGSNRVLVKITLNEFERWNLDNPVLYKLTTHLKTAGKIFDNLSSSFGMRSFEMKDNFFYLNGKKIILKGLLHMQQYPKNLAYPVSRDEAHRIVRLLKEGGWNLIRLHIRPGHPWFLDACDEEGMLLFEEPSIGWIVETEYLRERCMTEVREMVRRDRNHPSIVIWGLLNESGVRGAPDVLGRTKMYWNQGDLGVQKIKNDLARAIREEDPTRFITDDSGAVTCNYYLPGSYEPVNYYDNHLYMSYPISHAGFEVFRNLGRSGDFFRSHQFGNIHIDPHRIAGGAPDKLFFQSEFGAGGIPVWTEALKAYDHSTVEYMDEKVYRTIDRQLREYYEKELTDVFLSYEDVLRQTQTVQASTIHRMIDALRSNPHCSGYVWTQLNDTDYECNAGVLDPVFNPKKAFFAAKEANNLLHLVLETFPRTICPGGSLSVIVYLVNDTHLSGPMELHLSVAGPDDMIVHDELISFHAVTGIQEIYCGEVSCLSEDEDVYTARAELFADDKLLESALYKTHVIAPLPKKDALRPINLIHFDGGVHDWLVNNTISFETFEVDKLSNDSSILYVIEPLDETQLSDDRIPVVLEQVKNGADALFLGLPLICLSDHDEKLQELRDRGKYVCWCSPAEFENDIFPFPIDYYDSKPRFAGPYHFFKKHPVFEGLDPGNILDDRFADIMPDTSLRIKDAVVLGGSFGTPPGWHFKVRGCKHARDLRSGADFCIMPFGKGRLLFNTYKIMNNLLKDPVADKLLFNMLSVKL